MKRMLFNATYQEELRVALVEGQKLINFDIETNIKTQRRGNVYCGVITRVEPSLEACFVDYGTEKQGFLPFKEIDLSSIYEGAKFRDYSKLSEGTKVIIQVEKDERGNKGAALTTYISLPGRYLVLMPNHARSGGISRRIEGEEREELKALLSQLSYPNGMGVIARTAALGRVVEELQWDLNYLLKLWYAIKTAAQNHNRALIYQESNLVIRSIRDHFSPDVEEILIDEEGIYNEARNFMASVMPNFVNRIKYYHDDIQLFSRFQVEHQIESAYSRVVNLPSGGAIVIDHTEALVSVDVNSAKANKAADIEATALATNMEASEEIARQLRLRDIGGLVVVDFIDMENPKNQREVENHFKLQLGFDRARIQMGKLSKFGLLELSRQRLQASLEESTTITCPRCSGMGVIRGVESIAVHILRIIQEEAVRGGHYVMALHVQVPVEVATYLLNEKREDVTRIESRLKVKIMLIPNVHMDSPQYRIKKINTDAHDFASKKQSFNLVEMPEETQLDTSGRDKDVGGGVLPKAAVKNVLPNQPAPVIRNSLFGGIFLRLVKMFSGGANVDKKDELRLKSGAKPAQTQGKSLTKQAPNAKMKSRPVGVNNSNQKIQTVRPTTKEQMVTNKQANQQNVVVKSDTAVVEPKNTNLPADGLQNRAKQPKMATPAGQSNADNSPKGLRTKVERGIKSPQNTKAGSTAVQAQTPTKLDVELKPKLETVHLVSGSLVKNDVEIPKAVKLIVGDNRNAVDEVKVAVENMVEKKNHHTIGDNVPQSNKVRPHKNTIVEPVDLGNLIIVNTDKSLPEQPVSHTSISNKKRVNDVIKVVAPEIKQEVHYEMVETKRTN